MAEQGFFASFAPFIFFSLFFMRYRKRLYFVFLLYVEIHYYYRQNRIKLRQIPSIRKQGTLYR